MRKTAWLAAFVLPFALAAETKVTAGDPATDARKVLYHYGQGITAYGQFGWKTVIVLPSEEKILDAFSGDPDNWDAKGPGQTNFYTVAPRKAGVRKSNLQLITAAGHVYPVVLVDVSSQPDGHADSQIVVELADEEMQRDLKAKPRFAAYSEVEAFKAIAQRAEDDSAGARMRYERELADAGEKTRAELPSKIRLYQYDSQAAGKSPWNIAGIFSDDKFTYVRAHPPEAFAVFERKDNGNVAVNVVPAGDGGFRTDRIIENGEFVIGKKHLAFSVRGE